MKRKAENRKGRGGMKAFWVAGLRIRLKKKDSRSR